MVSACKETTTVLVVDDYEDTLDAMVLGLREEGFAVCAASNGLDAIRQAAKLTPDAIVMDLCMSGIDGWEAIREIKAAPKTAHIPVIALTALPEHWNRTKAEAAGCDAYLEKPCGTRDLATEIRHVVAVVTAREASRQRPFRNDE